MIVANPIYDIVFKYLMEDERIARTILSALLRKDIIKVEVRPHEYTNSQRDTLSVFSIDFGATIREADGTEHLILIELQKTWLETETLRFRQYLGVHYSNPKNMDGAYALPMVAIYLLGHKVGDIEEPVLYVNHQAYDYYGNEVVKGLPNPFVDSLTHSSIIVQIPRLHGQINNRLDKVLSIFDQTRKEHGDEHVLRLDEQVYADDAEMERILHRLTAAAADADMRHNMNVEDEYFSIIEKRDTEILMRDQQIAKQEAQLAEQNAQLSEQNARLSEQKAQLTEQKAQLTEQNAQLTEQKTQLTEQKAQLTEQKAQLTEQKAQLTEQKAQLTEQNARLSEQKAQLTEQKAQLTEQKAQLSEQNARLSEQNARLSEQEDMLRMSVKTFIDMGMDLETIAAHLKRSVQEIAKLI